MYLDVATVNAYQSDGGVIASETAPTAVTRSTASHMQ